jgi:CubicO group peptidase (beta-lactamase class C family)
MPSIAESIRNYPAGSTTKRRRSDSFENRCRRLGYAITLLPFILAPEAFAGSGQPLPVAMNAYMQARIKANDFSGTVLVARKGKILLSRAYGEANREWRVPNSPTTRFRIGSITKQFTATLIMQLQERHKLQVMDLICQYFDPCPEAWKAITIRHLLSHTAGIPNYTDEAGFGQKEPLHWNVDQLIAMFRDKPLEFPPGSDWKYSNSGYVLLGAIIEKVTGKSYEAALEELILVPLHMSDSGIDHREVILDRRAAGYSIKGGIVVNATFVDLSWGYSAGAMYSTTLDLYKWDRALRGDSILPQAALKEMWTPVRNRYGYGWAIIQSGEGAKKRLEVSHDGGLAGVSASITRFPEDDAVVIVLANIDGGQAAAAGNALKAIVYGEPYLPPAKVAGSTAALDRYVGDYEVEKQGVIRFSRQGQKLSLQLMSVPGQPAFPAIAVSDSKIICENMNASVEFKPVESVNGDEMVITANGGKTIRIGRRVLTQ